MLKMSGICHFRVDTLSVYPGLIIIWVIGCDWVGNVMIKLGYPQIFWEFYQKSVNDF